jgi:hypothetical protein
MIANAEKPNTLIALIFLFNRKEHQGGKVLQRNDRIPCVSLRSLRALRLILWKLKLA